MRLVLLIFCLLLGLAGADESQKANLLFEEAFERELSLSPEMMSQLGQKTDYHRWDDRSSRADERFLQVTRDYLERVQQLDRTQLDPQTRLSYDLFVRRAHNRLADDRFRLYNYPVNQMFGRQSELPAFLVNVHRIDNEQDTEAYISRLEGVALVIDQLIESLKEREAAGILPPRFVFDRVLSDCRGILTGAPLDSSSQPHLLYRDFSEKLQELDLSDARKATLLAQAETALLNGFAPGYRRLISFLEDQRGRADDRAGAWKFPEGEAFYQRALERTTTTDLTADEIHQLGLREVERIHGEMRVIQETVGFEGDLQQFFAHMRDEPEFYFPNTEAGKEAYLKEATALVEAMEARLDELFVTQPKAPMVVKRVEAFREKTAGKAFYERPSMDGSRPGIYYVNLYDTKDVPRYQMEALAFHEGIPGHHMQLSIAQELDGIPRFRCFTHYTAYIEGWGLYCELLPKEIGFYQDPYSDFGRLAMELWRACRLVVDTGIHAKKWTREQGIAFYRNNTPNSLGDCVKMVERHIVMPGQATAYKVGMLTLLRYRDQARQKLGDRFDIRKFHEVVLTNGPLPLDLLKDQVDLYIDNG